MQKFQQLQDVLHDDEFPALDVALRRGRHVDRDDLAWYQLLTDGQELLEPWYRRYGCELVHKTDGYYYLLPTTDRVPRRHLAVGDMLVGQALALLYLDPASIERGGLVTRDQVVAQLVAIVGEEALVRTFHAKKRRIDERAAHKMVRAKIADAVKRLAQLGFVDVVGEDGLRLRAALLRFAEPVRGVGAPAEALARLVADGEVAMAEAEAETEFETEFEAETEAETEAEAETEPEAEIGTELDEDE
jgi:chromosome partition protein MukE